MILIPVANLPSRMYWYLFNDNLSTACECFDISKLEHNLKPAHAVVATAEHTYDKRSAAK